MVVSVPFCPPLSWYSVLNPPPHPIIPLNQHASLFSNLTLNLWVFFFFFLKLYCVDMDAVIRLRLIYSFILITKFLLQFWTNCFFPCSVCTHMRVGSLPYIEHSVALWMLYCPRTHTSICLKIIALPPPLSAAFCADGCVPYPPQGCGQFWLTLSDSMWKLLILLAPTAPCPCLADESERGQDTVTLK